MWVKTNHFIFAVNVCDMLKLKQQTNSQDGISILADRELAVLMQVLIFIVILYHSFCKNQEWRLSLSS